MRKFFARNIDRRGRIVRGVWGTALIGSGLALWRSAGWICLALILAGGFALYEAVSGWCLLRACGIKTRL
jgi:hypothetical protein